MLKPSRGFTIVELLIVIIVIGILAAITIVAYNGIQSRARASAASAALNQASKKILVAMNDGTLSTYPANQAAFDALNIASGDVTYQYTLTGGGTGYCITATSGTTSYKITESSTPTAGGCAGHGQGGVQAITNQITNPSFETNLTGWWWTTGGGTASTARITSGAVSGSAYMRGTWSTAAASSQQTGITIPVSVTPGTTYTFSASARPSWGSATWYAIIAWRDAANAIIGTTNGTAVSTPANVWTRLSVSSQPPSGTTSVTAYLQSSTGFPLAGSTFDVDAAIFSTGSSNFADGNSADWIWNGAVNNSTSTGPPL